MKKAAVKKPYDNGTGDEIKDVTHGVGTVYLPRKFSHEQCAFYFERFFWGPWIDFFI